MTDNVYAIMNVKNDGTFVIQPGLKGNIEYLIDLLKTKCIEGAELAKSSKHNQSSSSTIPKSTSTVTSNNTTEKRKYKSFNLPVAENTTYIIDTLNNCCENNKSKLNIQRFSLVECEYYFILIRNDSNGALKCDIRCCYQKWLSLPLKRGKFQLSNFYRYLQGINNICPALKKMISNPQSALPSSTNNPSQLSLEESPESPLTNPRGLTTGSR
ncbi:unnamed protein product [Rotaria magnacalcarata]|uniref:Uncharacterized protein n=2 Tax=Rotaria magnacalcarata TaxID=392030 RepID=A0A816L2D5_9BILA|nr:unnamed protein product [Rotaria magnacalcarata]